ncbi:FAD-dependent oxidoreductase [Pseudomonas sp. TH49]|uniref:flavin monoamine oxidase family protein n=1 Tax=Pseudomonas sp. TH49 TaxID=2796413 RepID=UPI0019141C39|nr:FAD-dependent oxidoreductase [Pseudomonas sp. TH49]MBK5344641.1 FAD-dependent oxidoreductase [Pseudomonas sp. TH49]
MNSNDDEPSKPDPQRRLILKAMGGATLLAGLTLNVSNAAEASNTSDTGILDVVIIGAGLSGLTSARDLKNAGCESFVVLEARDRVGGRTYNHDLGNGLVSEAGGQWIGPGQTAVFDLARELNVETFPSYYEGKAVFFAGDAKVEQDTSDGLGFDPELVRKINDLSRTVPSKDPWNAKNAAELDKLSVGDWLSKQNVRLIDKVGFNTTMTLSFGGPPASVGLLQYLSVINTSDCSLENLEGMKGGAQETRLVGGSQILSVRMAEALGNKVQLSCPVRRIVGWDRDVVEVHTDQAVFRARKVVAALSPALCNQIAFDPPLPSGRAQLQNLWPAHGPMRKTAHVYEKPFWRAKGLNGQIVQTDGPVILAYDNSPPDGSLGVINAFVRTGNLSSEAVTAQSTLSAIYAKALGEQALNPIQFHDQDWGKIDPWTLTCMNPIPPGFWTKWGEFLKPAIGNLIWSGSENADIWAGAMDGAVRSGHRAALEVLQALVQVRRTV